MGFLAENKTIIRGLWVNYLHMLVSFVSLVVLTPILLKFLGQAGYGVWAVFGSIMSYFVLCDFGLNTAVVKYVAECRVLKQEERLNRIISTTFLFMGVLGGIVVFVCFGLSYFVTGIFGISNTLAPAARIAFVLVGANVALGLLGGVFGNLLYGYERIDIWKGSSIVQQVVNFVLAVSFLHLGFGLIGVAMASISGTIAVTCLYLMSIRFSAYGIRVRPSFIDTRVIKEILPFSLRTFVLGLSSRFLYYSDNVVIGLFLGVALVTPYEIVYKLCFLPTYLFSAISTIAFPRFSSLYTKGELDDLRDLYLRIAKVSLVIMTSVGLGLLFLGQSFIGLWVGDENFAGMGVLVLLVAMNIFHAIGTPAAALLQGIGRNRELMWSEICNGGLNVILSMALVTKIGLPGVAVGTLVAHLCSSFWVVLLLPCRYTKVSVGRYLSSCVLPPLLSSLPAGALAWGLMRELPRADNFAQLMLRGIIVTTTYAAVYLVVGTTREERQMYFRLVKRMASA